MGHQLRAVLPVVDLSPTTETTSTVVGRGQLVRRGVGSVTVSVGPIAQVVRVVVTGVVLRLAVITTTRGISTAVVRTTTATGLLIF